MKEWRKTLLTVICVLGMGASFAARLWEDPDMVGEIKAPVHVNIEIDRDRAKNVYILARVIGGKARFVPSPTTGFDGSAPTVVLYSAIFSDRDIPIIWDLFLLVPEEEGPATLAAIEGISVFIGNKLFYFSRNDIAAFQGQNENAHTLYRLPGLSYEKSFAGPWINWYGDLNMIVKAALAFFAQPLKFAAAWAFLLALLISRWERAAGLAGLLGGGGGRYKRAGEIAALALIMAAGFLLRFNGYTRYSAWYDEMYSACVASNPNRPFLSAFGDPGNPPLYFILLRLWFIVFGWSGESGRMLSVVLGTASLLSFYVLAKHFAGAKAALLAAFLMAANTRLIDQSQQTRGYILQVLLVPIVMYRFSLFLENQKPANLILYILSAALLVNTHYYGVLFALAVFCFFVYSEVSRKCFTWKRTAPFLLGNAVIALSLLPFFLLTALREALLNGGFNTWIPKPGLAWKAALPLFAILFALYVSAGKTWLKTKMPDPRFRLLDFAVFTAAVVFILALAISLFRPVFVMRYFPLLIPLAYAAGAALLGSLPRADSRTGKALYLAGVYAALLLGMETRPGGTGGRWDVFHEAQAYVSIDSDSHPEYKSAEMSPLWDPKLYGLTALPPFAPGGHYGAVYFNPVHEHVSDDDRYFLMVKAGIDPGKILRIRINEKRSVFKAYL